MIADLRAEVESLNATLDRIKDSSEMDIKAGAKSDIPVSDHLMSLLQDIDEMPEENTKKGAHV